MSNKFLAIATTDAAGAEIAAKLEEFERRPWPRVFMGAAMSGGAALGDSKAGIYVEDVKIGEVINTRLLLAPNRDDMQPIRAPIPANARLSVKMLDAMNTNAGTLLLEAVP